MLELRPFDRSLIGTEYLSWLNDPEVMKFLDRNSFGLSMFELDEWVQTILLSDNDYLMSVHFDGLHIGNVKIGDINYDIKRAEIGLIIGNRNYWSKGLGRKVIEKAARVAYEDLKITHLYAGMNIYNTASLISFLKEGFIVTEYIPEKERDIYDQNVAAVMLECDLVRTFG